MSMSNVEILKSVLSHAVEDRAWIPVRDSVEEVAILDMAELGWIDANPATKSGIGITDRGMDRYATWSAIPEAV